MRLYKLIPNTWNKVTITLLQRARNIHTIVDALVYNRSRSKLYPKAQRSRHHVSMIDEISKWSQMYAEVPSLVASYSILYVRYSIMRPNTPII